MLIPCESCAASISDQAVACPQCGHPRVGLMRCSECGKSIPAKAAICSSCGAPTTQTTTSATEVARPPTSVVGVTTDVPAPAASSRPEGRPPTPPPARGARDSLVVLGVVVGVALTALLCTAIMNTVRINAPIAEAAKAEADGDIAKAASLVRDAIAIKELVNLSFVSTASLNQRLAALRDSRPQRFADAMSSGRFDLALAATGDDFHADLRPCLDFVHTARAALITAMTDQEYADFIGTGTIPVFMGGLSPEVVAALRTSLVDPARQRTEAREITERGASVREAQCANYEQRVQACTAKLPRLFRVTGRIVDRMDNKLLLWGRAQPLDDSPAARSAEGTVIVADANLQVEPFAQSDRPILMGGFYSGNHHFRGRSSAPGRMGGIVPVFLYGDYPNDDRSRQAEQESQQLFKQYDRLRAQDPVRLREWGVKYYLPRFQ